MTVFQGLPNLTIWATPFFFMFLPEVAYYATNNPNHVFFLFLLSFLKVCFHTIVNKSKNIVFHVNFPPLPCMCLWLTSGFNLWLFHSVITYQAVVFPLTYASSIFLDNILQLSFSIYFSNLNMVIRSSNSCFSLFIYRGTPPCDHPVYTTTSCLSSPPIVFPPRRENLRVILLFWRPL